MRTILAAGFSVFVHNNCFSLYAVHTILLIVILCSIRSWAWKKFPGWELQKGRWVQVSEGEKKFYKGWRRVNNQRSRTEYVTVIGNCCWITKGRPWNWGTEKFVVGTIMKRPRIGYIQKVKPVKPSK